MPARSFLVVFALIALLTSVHPAFAQLGEAAMDPAEVDRMIEWQPEPRGEMESIVVDLRHRMPPVQAQSMNDCTSWAYGYAAKSYQEVIDQGWRADATQRQFSPRFLYNQLNKGADNGVNPAELLKFLETHGCATLRTCPYVPRDYKGGITAAAIEEAKLFRISGHYVLKGGPSLRLALQQGHVCPISIRTNPIFNSGKYDVYDTKMHEKGLTLRKAGDKHGMHAMAAVGYDDKKGAFLLMNSWGADWGQRGYCWVSYDVANKFNYVEKTEKELCNFSVVIQDLREKVDVGPGGGYVSARPDKETILIQAGGDYRGYNPATRSHQYFYSAWLTGQTQALDLVESVKWENGLDPKAVPIVATARNNYFRFSNAAAQNVIPVSAFITFKDKTTRALKVNITLPPPSGEHRQVEMIFRDWYQGRWQRDGQSIPAWQWEIEVTGNLTDLNDIDRVTFNVGNMNRVNPTATYDSDKIRYYFGGKIQYSGISNTTNPIAVDVVFRDGGKKTLKLNPVFTAPVDDTVGLDNSFREDGQVNGETWYSWTIRFKSPRDICPKIDHILYDLGPTQGNRQVRVGDLYGGFLVSGSAKREFRATATVKYTDGRTQQMEHWVTLGRSARYADPRRIEIDVEDEYFGIDAHQRPIWRAELKPLGDFKTLDEIVKVNYEFPEGYKPRERELAREGATRPTFALDLHTSKPVQLVATVHYKDGHFTRFPVDVQPKSPRNDRLALSVRTGMGTLDDKPTPWWTSELAGPAATLERVSKVDYRFFRDGITRRRVLDFGYHRQTGIFNNYDFITDEGSVEALVTFNDGSLEQLRSYLSKSAIGFNAGPLPYAISVREKFWGYEKGIPRWLVTVEAVGTPEAIKGLGAVHYDWVDDRGQKQSIKFDPETDAAKLALGAAYRHEFFISTPTMVHAWVNFYGKRIALPRLAPAMAPRTSEPVVMKQARFTHDLSARPLPVLTWFVYIDGWEEKLREIKQVEYQFPLGLGGHKVAVADRFAERHAGFALMHASTGPATMGAVITFKDGSKQQAYVQTALPPAPLDVVITDKYWGFNEKKEPTWRVTYHLTGDYWEHLSKIFRAEYFLKGGPRGRFRVDEWPLFEATFDATQDEVLAEYSAGYRGAGWKTSKPNEPIKLKSPRVDLLGLRQAPGVSPPADHAGPLKEWVVHAVGPEKIMQSVAAVSYEIDLPGGKRSATIANRWGELHDGFELRYFADAPVQVKGVIKMKSGGELPLMVEPPK